MINDYSLHSSSKKMPRPQSIMKREVTNDSMLSNADINDSNQDPLRLYDSINTQQPY